MNIVEIPADQRSVEQFAAWRARNERRMRLLVRRMIPWSVRKSPEAVLVEERLLDASRQMARRYMNLEQSR